MTEDDHRGAQGLPGRPGAEGRPGTEGRAGAEGRPGSAGETGETGREGATGAQGHVGLRGRPGSVGVSGLTGDQGSTGETGPRGRDGVSSTRRLLVMFIFVVVAFAVLSIRADRAAREVGRATEIACEHSNANSLAINNLLDVLIGLAQKSTAFTPAEKHERVAEYRASRVHPLAC